MKATLTTRLHPRLPVFLLEDSTRHALYTPGKVRSIGASLAGRLREERLPEHDELTHALFREAQAAEDRWLDLSQQGFDPECLTLYLSNACQLACSYCYSAPPDGRESLTPHETVMLSRDSVERAALRVAQTCRERGLPLTVVFHGGGEPTLHRELLADLVATTRSVAVANGIEWRSYIATHGVVSKDCARWLAETFSLIGISCDGPPEIQDRGRPSRSGQRTSQAVERTARVLRDASADFCVRATVTRESIARQADIVRYTVETLGTRTLRIEPAYENYSHTTGSFAPDDAVEFVEQYRRAEQVARELGCRLEISGCRPREIHGPYCNILRQVLQLTPDGSVSACFLSIDGESDISRGFRIDATPHQGAERLALDTARIAEMQQRAARVPERCRDCVNVYHCARDCPETCPVASPETENGEGGFRCQVLRALAEEWILSEHLPS